MILSELTNTLKYTDFSKLNIYIIVLIAEKDDYPSSERIKFSEKRLYIHISFKKFKDLDDSDFHTCIIISKRFIKIFYELDNMKREELLRKIFYTKTNIFHKFKYGYYK